MPQALKFSVYLRASIWITIVVFSVLCLTSNCGSFATAEKKLLWSSALYQSLEETKSVENLSWLDKRVLFYECCLIRMLKTNHLRISLEPESQYGRDKSFSYPTIWFSARNLSRNKISTWRLFGNRLYIFICGLKHDDAMWMVKSPRKLILVEVTHQRKNIRRETWRIQVSFILTKISSWYPQRVLLSVVTTS